jgi:cis-3-alkyl-4-acyloxetan-2-one decarboxylase
MGCLISVRVARLRPDLVRHLVLYEMPLYNGLPDKRSYRLRLKFYFALYERIIAFKPIFNGPGKKRAQKLAEKIAGFTLDDATWPPFIRSLKHTIMEQKTHEDIKQIKLPMDVIYGTRDRVVIRGKTAEIFGQDVANITAHNIRENHGISKKASSFLVSRVEAALTAAESPARTDDPDDVRL